EGDALRVRETRRLFGDLHHVRVLRDRPERLEPGRRDVCDRLLGAQARPDIVRVAALRVTIGVDQVEWIDVETHRGSLGSSSSRSPMTLRWISLVPPMIEFARVDRSVLAHRFGVSSASGPRTATAVSASRSLMFAQNSLTQLD